MTLVAVLVVLAVIGVVAAVVTGAVRGDLDEPTSNLAPSGLPEGDVSAEDVRAVRFSLGFRGYRMDQVDEVLDRLTLELARRDAELHALRKRAFDEPPADERSADAPPAEEPSADGASADERRLDERDAHDRPTGATAAPVGPSSGATGWSGPEGG